jgi:preprotein translocase subunit SecD
MAERRHHGIARRALAGAALLAVLGLGIGLAACGDDGPGSEPRREGCGDGAACPETTTTIAATPIDLQLRPVLSTSPSSASGQSCPSATDGTTGDAVALVPSCTGGVVDLMYSLGPVALTGSAFASARAVENGNTGEWVVNPVLKQGAEGIDTFNAVAARCFAKETTCPTGQLAIVVDGVVTSAPTIQTSRFEADQIQISGNLTETSATALAAGIDAAG